MHSWIMNSLNWGYSLSSKGRVAEQGQTTTTVQGRWASRSRQPVRDLLAYLDLGMGKSALNTLDTTGFPVTLTVTDCAIMAQ